MVLFNLAASILVERMRGGMEIGILAGRGFTRTGPSLYIRLHILSIIAEIVLIS